MSAVPQQLTEVFHAQYEDPRWAIAAAAVGVAGVGFHALKHHNASKLDNGIPFADPEVAEQAQKGLNRTHRRETAAYYSAVLAFGFGALHMTHPYSTSETTRGNATIVIDANYRGDIADMQGNASAKVSRLDASIEGSLAAAARNDVPFSFVLEGRTSQVIARMPTEHKDIAGARSKISKTLQPEFRNGQSLINGVDQALPLSGDSPNNVIILAPNLNGKDANSVSDADALKQLEDNMKKFGSNGKQVYAVVIGQGQGETKVGAETLSAPTDIKAFTDELGADHVKAAHSADEIAQAIDGFATRNLKSESKQPVNTFEEIAIGSAALGGVIALRRKLAGTFHKSKASKGRN